MRIVRFDGAAFPERVASLLPWVVLCDGAIGLAAWYATGGNWPQYKALAYTSGLVMMVGGAGLAGAWYSKRLPRAAGWLVLGAALWLLCALALWTHHAGDPGFSTRTIAGVLNSGMNLDTGSSTDSLPASIIISTDVVTIGFVIEATQKTESLAMGSLVFASM